MIITYYLTETNNDHNILTDQDNNDHKIIISWPKQMMITTY